MLRLPLARSARSAAAVARATRACERAVDRDAGSDSVMWSSAAMGEKEVRLSRGSSSTTEQQANSERPIHTNSPLPVLFEEVKQV